MIQIRVEGARRWSQHLADIEVGIRRGPTGLSRKTVKFIATQIAAWNKINFDRGISFVKGKGIWFKRVAEKATPIHYRTLVFSRQANHIGFLHPTMEQLKYKASQVDELKDTRRLYKSVTNADDRNFRILVRGNAIVFGTDVPYADKHLYGRYATFKLGSTERRRLRERVPPPGKGEGGAASIMSPRYGKISISEVEERPSFGAKLKRIKKKIGSEEYERRRNNARAYYVLLGWAKKNYPLRTRLPIRNWYRALPSEMVVFFVEIIWMDLMRKRISLTKRGVQARIGYMP